MEQQERIMDGDLQTLGLQSILKMLALSGKTGKLFVHSGPETLSISLHKGQIVALHEEGGSRIDLPGMLCLLGRLTPPNAQMLRDLAQGDIQATLQMMVERGWMSMEEMQRRLEFAVTQSISHALRWVNGRFAFHRQMIPMGGKMRPLDVDSTLLEALRQADEWEEVVAEGISNITRNTVARWLPEVNRDIRNLGLSQECIEVLCLSNGEIPLQAISLVLMTPEARVARIMMRLLELRLVEVVDMALEAELQRDLSNIIIKSQHTLVRHRQTSNPEQLLQGLIITFADCINGLLAHHGHYARSMRGRGQVPESEVIRYLERRFMPLLQQLSGQQYPILETVTMVNGLLDCNDILTLNKVVKGGQLEEFYWEAVQGLSVFLRTSFDMMLRDEVGNSHTGRQLNLAWKVFLSEVENEVQRYQLYRAQRNVQARGRETIQGATGPVGAPGSVGAPNWNGANGAWGGPSGEASRPNGAIYWSPETQSR
jgi:hypothetical protein